MLLFGMSYICLQIFQLIGISHTHFLSYNPILTADITVQSVKELGLTVGKEVVAVIKSTSIMVGVE